MKLKLTNNAETTLAGLVNDSTTTVLFSPGTGQKFPQLAAGEFFPLTLIKTSGGIPTREILYVTARNVDSCTVLRAQEGTIAQSFATGDYAGNHPTAGTLLMLAQLEGANFTGPVDMADQKLTQAVMADCADAFYDNVASGAIDIRRGKSQRWAPGTGAQTLTLTGWPLAGNHGEFMLEGVNLGAATITIAGNPTRFISATGAFTTSTSLNTNHGATLQSNGIDFVVFWTRDGGATVNCKVIR